MPIRNANGKILNTEEVTIITQIIKDSLDSHAKLFKKFGDDTEGNDFRAMGVFHDNYSGASAEIEEKIRKMASGKKDITVTELFDGIIADINEKSAKEIGNLNTDDYSETFDYMLSDFGDRKFHALLARNPNEELLEMDRTDAVANTTVSFKLAEEAFEGLQDIEPYNPNSDRVFGLKQSLAGNSTSLGESIEELDAEIKEFSDPTQHTNFDESQRENRLKELNDKKDKKFRGDVGLSAGVETARIKASELINKDKVSAADMCGVFIELNKAVRVGDPEGGKLRGHRVSAGDILGVGSNRAPSDFYETMGIIADNMNRIRLTQVPALQKTQAIQLAAYAYQMTISEHLFEDGNGRSCRLLADTILESFGLPPHTPTPDELGISHTIGTPLDFDKGAQAILKGVKLSSEALIQQRAEEAEKDPNSINHISEEISYAHLQKAAQKNEAVKTTVNRINDNFLANTKKLKEDALNAKSSFHNSTQYNNFYTTLEVTTSIVEAVNQCKKDGKEYIDLNKLHPIAQEIAKKQGIVENNQISLDNSGHVVNFCFAGLKQTAKSYEDYKMKDHTADRSAEPGKKELNRDDIRKLNIIKKVLGEPQIEISLGMEKPVQQQVKSGAAKMPD